MLLPSSTPSDFLFLLYFTNLFFLNLLWALSVSGVMFRFAVKTHRRSLLALSRLVSFRTQSAPYIVVAPFLVCVYSWQLLQNSGLGLYGYIGVDVRSPGIFICFGNLLCANVIKKRRGIGIPRFNP